MAVPLDTAGRTATRLDGAVQRPHRVVAHFDTAHIHQEGGTALALNGLSARIVSEVVAFDGPVPWQVLGRELWPREDDDHLLRRKLDVSWDDDSAPALSEADEIEPETSTGGPFEVAELAAEAPRSDLRVVLLSGDVYLRVDDFASDSLVRRLNDRGLRVLVEPLGLLSEYLAEERLPGLLGLPVGRVHNGVVVISPWGCGPALVAESMLRHEVEIPLLFLYGDGSPLDTRRLDGFGLRLHRHLGRC